MCLKHLDDSHCCIPWGKWICSPTTLCPRGSCLIFLLLTRFSQEWEITWTSKSISNVWRSLDDSQLLISSPDRGKDPSLSPSFPNREVVIRITMKIIQTVCVGFSVSGEQSRTSIWWVWAHNTFLLISPVQQELLGTEASSLFWKGLLTRRAGLACNLWGTETTAQEGALLLILSLPLYFFLLKSAAMRDTGLFWACP